MSVRGSPQGEGNGPWTQETRDRWFFGALAASTLAVLYLFSTFMYVLLFALVVVVVTLPFYQRMLRLTRGRSALAAALTTLVLAIAIFGPIGFLVYLFVQEAIALIQVGVEFVNSGKLAGWIGYLLSLPESELVPDWIQEQIPDDFDLQKSVMGPLQDAVLTVLNATGSAVPALLSTTMGASIDAVIFVFAVITLYMEGPRILRVVQNLSPMDDAYEERLFDVFQEFANNLVVGALATAVVQGVVAGIGYQIAGVERVIFFAILTGVFSFVPIVGTLVIWVPLSIMVAVQHGLGWGLFLAGWSIVFTAQVDSIVRPMFMRGRTNIHPLLIFLAVFGGMAWMGLPGALVGPVLVAFFLALYTIYVHDYLGHPPEESPAMVGGARAALARLPIRRRPTGTPVVHRDDRSNGAPPNEAAAPALADPSAGATGPPDPMRRQPDEAAPTPVEALPERADAGSVPERGQAEPSEDGDQPEPSPRDA